MLTSVIVERFFTGSFENNRKITKDRVPPSPYFLCREETGENLLNISAIISEDSNVAGVFNATWALVVTWLNVPEISGFDNITVSS